MAACGRVCTRLLRTKRALLQRLHHQSLSVHRRFDGGRPDWIAAGLGLRVGRLDENVSPGGSRSDRCEGPGAVEQKLGQRDGGSGGGRARGRDGMGFEVRGLRVSGDFDVGLVRGLAGRLVGRRHQREQSWKQEK